MQSQERLLLPCSLLYQIWIPFHNLGFFQSPLMGSGRCTYLTESSISSFWSWPDALSHVQPVLCMARGFLISGCFGSPLGCSPPLLQLQCEYGQYLLTLPDPPLLQIGESYLQGWGLKTAERNEEQWWRAGSPRNRALSTLSVTITTPPIFRETEGTCPRQSISSCPLPSSLKSTLLLTGRCAQWHPPTLLHTKTDTCTATISILHVLNYKSRG